MQLRFATQHVEWFPDGRKNALLLPALSVDQYQEVPGGPWRLRDDGYAHGKPVTAVRYAAMGCVIEEGGILPLRSLVTHETVQVQVTGIRMVEVDDLGDQDLRELGYTTRDEYWKCGGWFLAGQIGWFLSATLASRVPVLH